MEGYTVFGTWTNEPHGNGLIVTGPKFRVHVVFTRDQARGILEAHPREIASQLLSQVQYLPEASAHTEITICGLAGLVLAETLIASSANQDTSFATPYPRQFLFFPSMPTEDVTKEAPTLLIIEADERMGFHCYVLFSREDGRRYIHDRTWIPKERRKLCLELLEGSLLPEGAETPPIHITGHAAREIFSAGARYVRGTPVY